MKCMVSQSQVVVSSIIHHFGVRSVCLMTNNLDKLQALERCGVKISARVPIETGLTEENVDYLRTKAERMKHQLRLENVSRAKNGKPC